MDNPWVIGAITVALIAASAFFVAVEFALIAARRHRLEDEAATSSSARAALRSASELSVLLAGSQLGITVCTLALGSITKPAVHHWLTPLFETWGLPYWSADIVGFVLALIVVTFLHLVVGEMAPKSWAIAHPERSAIVLALPMRAFMWLTRPIIVQLNHLANWCLRRVGVEPVDQVATGQDSDALRHLVEHSATVGTLDERYHAHLTSALELESLTLGDVVTPSDTLGAVLPTATADEIQTAGRISGHLRLLVRDADRGPVHGVVHVRDSLRAAPDATAADLMRPVLRFESGQPVYEALAAMRERRAHLALVTDSGRAIGLITLNDLLQRLLATTA
ncbi:hemolysin family protein [Gordonia alkanivorans]|uniref:HlyC/CorC family transporter n=1 Tax=Gordonia rubripertincta TaxID=36822 RepID=A0AAW4GAQ5_GORRU|nr:MULTISPECIES: hemolysin family protein [Gordonia]ASR01140.1 Hemolysin C [Gordonia rubripertincta]MBM7280122.1 HlyC/CorC family transporter [Gordonia rubripertincta]MDH3026776.1 hemolysin family protein [Gordonia alkanivorans]QMU22152.1 HlyC/CorC family transporter [Gordonia rubripertincta]